LLLRRWITCNAMEEGDFSFVGENLERLFNVGELRNARRQNYLQVEAGNLAEEGEMIQLGTGNLHAPHAEPAELLRTFCSERRTEKLHAPLIANLFELAVKNAWSLKIAKYIVKLPRTTGQGNPTGTRVQNFRGNYPLELDCVRARIRCRGNQLPCPTQVAGMRGPELCNELRRPEPWRQQIGKLAECCVTGRHYASRGLVALSAPPDLPAPGAVVPPVADVAPDLSAPGAVVPPPGLPAPPVAATAPGLLAPAEEAAPSPLPPSIRGLIFSKPT